jgi:hypothetical protein
MRRSLTALFMSTLLFAAVSGTAAARHGWIHLGDRMVTDRADHDVLALGSKGHGLRALKIKVKKRPVEVRKVKIVFANGETQQRSIGRVIKAGGESRAIDLDGGERNVTRVEFWYDAQSHGHKAVVKLFGLR